MLRTRTAALLLSTALVTSAAVAQTTPATTPPTAAASTASGSTQFITDQAAGQFRASKFVGLDIYGPENQKVGDINEILIDGTGSAKAIVIGVGGFLGIGEKSVAVPFSAVTWVNERATGTTTAAMAPTAATAPMSATGAAPMRAPADVTGSTVPVRSPAEQAAYNGYPDHGTVTLTKADLQNAPTFKYYADTHARTAAPSNATSPPMAPVTPRQ